MRLSTPAVWNPAQGESRSCPGGGMGRQVGRSQALPPFQPEQLCFSLLPVRFHIRYHWKKEFSKQNKNIIVQMGKLRRGEGKR